MKQTYTNFYSPDDDAIYQIGDRETNEREIDEVDLEQIDQFQSEVEPLSTTSALTDLYASSQIEAYRRREQGDPDEYDFFADEQ